MTSPTPPPLRPWKPFLLVFLAALIVPLLLVVLVFALIGSPDPIGGSDMARNAVRNSSWQTLDLKRVPQRSGETLDFRGFMTNDIAGGTWTFHSNGEMFAGKLKDGRYPRAGSFDILNFDTPHRYTWSLNGDELKIQTEYGSPPIQRFRISHKTGNTIRLDPIGHREYEFFELALIPRVEPWHLPHPAKYPAIAIFTLLWLIVFALASLRRVMSGRTAGERTSAAVHSANTAASAATTASNSNSSAVGGLAASGGAAANAAFDRSSNDDPNPPQSGR